MVALYQSYDVPEEPSAVAAARADVERLQTGLPRALLATPPDVLRSIATRAARARRAAERWQQRVGPRPELADDAEAKVLEAKDDFASSTAAREKVVDQCLILLTRGNAIAVVALAAAGSFTLLGRSPMGLAVAVAVAAAPLGPLTAMWLAASRCSIASRDQQEARQRWAAALEATGVSSMGALAARRLAVRAWHQREREAAAAWEGARPHLRAWHRLAGPGVPPEDVETAVAGIEALRSAQLRLLGVLLDEHVSARVMDVLERPPKNNLGGRTPKKPAAPRQTAHGRPSYSEAGSEPEAEVAEPEAAPTWLEEALTRFRGGKLRLWGT